MRFTLSATDGGRTRGDPGQCPGPVSRRPATWSRPDANGAVGHLHFVDVEWPGGRAADHSPRGDVEFRAVALAHDHRPGEQAAGERARVAGARAEVVERVK